MKMAVRIKILKPMWIRGSGLSLKNKATLYAQVVRPVATYGCPAWSSAARTRRREISTLENKILRGILGAPWFVRNEQIRRELTMVPIDQIVEKRTKDTSEKILRHANRALTGISDYDPTTRPVTSRGIRGFLEPD